MTYAVHVANDSCNTRQSCAATGDDADVFIGVLTSLILTVGVVVQVRDRLAELFDTSRRRVLQGVERDVDGRGAFRRVWDIANFRRSLTEVCPFVGGRVGEAVRHGTVRAVDDTGAAGVLDTRNGLLVLWRNALMLAARPPGKPK